MRFTTRRLVKEFCQNSLMEGYASNKRLVVDENTLINYSTVIAYRTKGYVVLNTDYYSKTTSKHQNRIREYTHDSLLIETTHKKLQKLRRGEISVNELKEKNNIRKV